MDTARITSNQNPQIKELRKLKDKKYRQRTGTFAAEGEDLVVAALQAGWEPEVVFFADDAPVPAIVARHAKSLLVAPGVMDTASVIDSGARVIGIFTQKWNQIGSHQLTLYLDAIADPGNVGTMIRSALAFADGPVVLGPGCADPFSPKAVRASMGAVFTRPPVQGYLADLAGTKVALDGNASTELRDVDADGPIVLCVGSERGGLSEAVEEAADLHARIPMRGDGPESLNAAIAASLALYEVALKLQMPVHQNPSALPDNGNPAQGQN